MYKFAIACGISVVLIILLFVLLYLYASRTSASENKPEQVVLTASGTSSVQIDEDNIVYTGETTLEDFSMYEGALEASLNNQPSVSRYTKRGLRPIRDVNSINNPMEVEDQKDYTRFQTPTVDVRTENPMYTTHIRPIDE